MQDRKVPKVARRACALLNAASEELSELRTSTASDAIFTYYSVAGDLRRLAELLDAEAQRLEAAYKSGDGHVSEAARIGS